MMQSTVASSYQETNKKTASFLVVLLLCLFFVVSLINTFSNVATEVSIICFAIILVLTFSDIVLLNKKDKVAIIRVLFFCLLIFFYFAINISSNTFSDIGNYLDWGISIYAGIYILNNCSIREKNFLHILIYILFNLSLVLVIISSKSQGFGDASDSANAAYSSLIMLFSGACLIFTFNGKGLLNRLFSFASLLLSLYVNFAILQRGTNIFLLLFLLVFLLIFQFKKRSHRIFVILLLFLFSIFAINSGLIDNILSLISTKLDISRLEDRINTVLNFLKTFDYQNAGVLSFRLRIEYFYNSIRSFTSSLTAFFFGVGDHREDCLIIGNHSEIIDMFGRYGIVGGVTFIMILLHNVTLFYRNSLVLKRNIFSQYLLIFIVYLLRNVLGVAVGASFGILLIAYLPTQISFLKGDCKHELN